MTTTDTAPRPHTDPVPPVQTPSRPRPTAAVHDVRRTLLALLASALGTFPLCELFTDRGWLLDVWLTMAIVVGPAALLRLRRPPSAAQIWIGVVLLIPWLTVNFVRQHAVFGFLPFHGAWHDVGQLLTNLHNTTTDDVAPVHTSVAIKLAVCALLGLVAALVDLLAVVGRRGALAGIPLLIIYTVSGAVPRHPVSWIWFALAAAGFLILLALDSSDDLHRWGHYIPRSPQTSRAGPSAFSGQRIAAAAIALAVAVPLFIPSNSRNFVANLFHPHKTGIGAGFGADQNGAGGTGGIDAFAALRGQLVRGSKVNLLNVTINPGPTAGARGRVQPFYLRTNVLPVYQGDGWRPAPDEGGESVDDTDFESSPGTPIQPDVARFSADFTVTGLRSNPPVFGSPTSVTGLSSSTEWNTRDMLLLGSHINGGQHFHEDVAQPDPTIAELQAATASDRALSPWLELPDIAAYVRTLTAKVIGNATTPYAKTLAISNFFADPRNGFAYSLQTVAGDSGDELTDFLKNRVGYCQQFAAAMGVMLRLAGVPSRVVLGYAHDVPDFKGEFTVTTFDAHAWDEAYFSGIGWVPFDPTPLAGISGGAANDLTWAPHGKTQSGVVAPPPVDPGKANASKNVTATASASPVAATGTQTSSSSALPIAIAAIVLGLILVLLIPAAVRWRRRRRRLRLARHGDTDALWAELSDTATDLGYRWSSARSPRQVASWLGGSGDPATSGLLRTLTDAVERARYAPPAGPVPDLASDFGSVQAGLRARRTLGQRARATFWPASLRWSRVPFIGRWLPGAGAAAHR